MADEMMVKELEEVVVRFSGDSGDGMQLAGNIFSNVSFLFVTFLYMWQAKFAKWKKIQIKYRQISIYKTN